MHEVLSGRASERVSDPANVLLAADADSFSALSGLVDQSAPRTGSATTSPTVGMDVTAHPITPTTNPASLFGHSTRHV